VTASIVAISSALRLSISSAVDIYRLLYTPLHKIAILEVLDVILI